MIKIFRFFLILIFFSSCSLFHPFEKRKVKELDEEAISSYNFAFAEATKQKLFGNYSQALSLLFKCIDINPNSAAVYYLISEIYLKTGNNEKALDYCRKAVYYEPSNNWYRLDLATLYKINNKKDSAIVQYKRIIKKNKYSFKYKYNLAALYFESGDLYSSLKIIDDLLRKDKKNEELVITKFQIERKLKKYTSAEKTIKRIIKKLPEEYKYSGLLAEHYKSIGLLNKCETTYKNILHKDSTNEIAIIGLANYYLETRQYEKVEEYIDKYFLHDWNLSENKAYFVANCIKVEAISKAKRDSIASCIKNWLIDNYNTETDNRSIIELYINSGYSADAAGVLASFIGRKGGERYLELYFMALSSLESNDSLIEITSRKIEEGLRIPMVYYYNGIGYFKKKQYNDAVNSFLTGLAVMDEKKTFEEQLLILIGESYIKLENFEKGFYFFEKVLELNPYNLFVLNNYSYYLANEEVQLDKAKDMSYRCIMMDNKNFNYLDTYAWVLFKMGKYKESYEVIKKAFSLGGRVNTSVMEHYKEIKKVMNLKDDDLF